MKRNWMPAAVGVIGLIMGSILAFPADGKSARAEKKNAGELEIGAPAPKSDLKMPDVSGREISLKEAKDKKGLLVIFSCNTCPFVLAWEDRYLEIAQKCRDLGIGMIAVNSNEGLRDGVDSPEAMKSHAQEKGYGFPYVVDRRSELADAFGATRTPHVFLFDKKLTLVYRGAIDDNSRSPADVKARYLSDALDAVSKGKPVAVTSTKSIGCSIKRKDS